MKKSSQEQQYVMSCLNTPMMNYAVYVPKKSEKIVVNMILFLAGGVIGLLFYGGLFRVDGESTAATYVADLVAILIIGCAVMRLLMPVYVNHALEKRSRALKNQFRAMLSSLSASMSAGSNVQKAFEDALTDLLIQYKEDDYIVKEMREILNGMAQNVNAEVLIRDFGDRSGNEDIVFFADVFEICYRKGGDLKAVIQKTYHSISEKLEIEDEIETKLVSNKMQHNVMSIMPIIVVAMLKFTNDTFAENFATPVGVLVNTVAIGIFIASYRFGLKICDVKV